MGGKIEGSIICARRQIFEILIYIAVNVCPIEKGQVRDEYGNCICPLGYGKDVNDNCVPCRRQSNMVVNEDGYCVCDLEKGFSIDEYGHCVCPTRYGYRIDASGYCRQSTCQLFIFRDKTFSL